MPSLQTLVEYCDTRTRRTAYKDAPGSFNGLQVANSGNVTKIGAAVDASLDTFNQAAARGIDFLIVHHGMYWDMPKPITGPLYERIKKLLTANIALYSNHLPLDAHPELGNNALLARQLSLSPTRPFLIRDGEPIGWIAENTNSRETLLIQLQKHYTRVTSITCGSATPRAIAFCSGSGNSAVPELPRENVDTLITGELRQEWFTYAQEQKLNLFICGHTATEVHGVRALASELSAKFNLPWEFITTENPL